ncbi:MAG: precorrin-6y C5,15-methyltransferase (decarboxylating) subunit CbiE, partial [Planctomycetia bacterium]|nr:precorrin-6y C5,15-methyltransferase (decarboxylating) subunit CbiE [Planctomycetia bacterium]
IGDDGMEGLTTPAKQLVERAELLVGTKQSLEAVTASTAEKIEIGGDLDAVVRKVDAAGKKRIVVLAAGDPLFYGTARYLCDRLGKERFNVTPHVSSMQLAFARVKESWDDAYLTSLATQPLELVVEKTRTAAKVGLFTTEAAPPRAVAQALLDRKIDYFTAYVCENLGSPDERVTHEELAEIAKLDFSPLNVLILLRKPNVPDRPPAMMVKRLFGNPDEESVAIEAGQIASGGRVYAIEMDPEDYALIASNAERFGVRNLTPILGKAPEAWAGLAPPDAVFVGGTGRQVRRIVELAFEQLRPGGRLVANVGSVENIAAVREILSAKGGDADVLMINLARGNDQLERLHFESMHPTFLVSAVKGQKAK